MRQESSAKMALKFKRSGSIPGVKDGSSLDKLRLGFSSSIFGDYDTRPPPF